jgi:hypothetical protein
MQRAIGRAYQRLQTGYPGPRRNRHGLMVEIGCDVLLTVVVMSSLAAFGLLAWAMYAGFTGAVIGLALGLVGASASLLLVWERIAWQPAASRISGLS